MNQALKGKNNLTIITESGINNFRHALHYWFSVHKRDLPWRHTKDAYKIWVSEIVLQQTTVEQGLEYYKRFVKTFKSVYELAKAKEQEVLKLWQGLGYYSRARNMHKTAQVVANELKGVFPENYEDIIKLKGIGPYTAAAILSFAYNKPHSLADGNVMRVISRIFGIEEPVNTPKGEKLIKEFVNMVFDTERPSDFNQAVMEFGAIHCKKHKPLCNNCFAAGYCEAYKKNITHLLPVKLSRVKPKDRFFYYLIPLIIDNNKIFTCIKKRTAQDIWQNLYDFILLETNSTIGPEKFFKCDELKNFLNNNGIDINKIQLHVFGKPVLHKLTHQNIHAQFFVFMTGNEINSENCLKIPVEEIKNYPLPKIISNVVETYGSLLFKGI